MPPHTGLPSVGSDNNDWGTILNYFLEQAHDPSTGFLLTTPTNPNNLTGGSVNTNLATTTQPGLVQLAGDLTGTYSSPALASITTAGSVGSATAVPVITYDAKGRITAVSSATISGGVPVNSFGVDGGNSSTTFAGTLRVDFGGSV
jgi:hypothetical protein